MIIGFDAKRAFQNNTGLGNYSRMLICGLAQEYRDLQAVLYSPDMTGDYQSYFAGFANISTRQPSGWDRYLPNIWRDYGIGMHLAGDRVELYHGLSNELPYGIPQSVKKVVTAHGLMERSKRQRNSCRKADVVVAVSEYTKKQLMEAFHLPGEKIRVIYETCDQIFWQPVTDEERNDTHTLYHLPEKYFVCVGSIEERKNQVAVVEALAELPKDVHLVIVGRPTSNYYVDLQRAIREKDVLQRVQIIRDADFEDFPALYAGAVGSVYVSRSEGFGVPILESMYCDTPVIASNTSSMPEVAGDAALLVNPDDPHAIAESMLQLLQQPALRQELIAKGRRQREKFTQKKIVNQLWSLYNELLAT